MARGRHVTAVRTDGNVHELFVGYCFAAGCGNIVGYGNDSMTE